MTELDLTPQQPRPAAGRSWRNWLIMGTLGLVAAFVLYQALTSARVFFLNVDEAIEQRESLGDDTFQMQGTVISQPQEGDDGSLVFTIAFGGEEARIRHVGNEPSSLFKVGERIVTEGRWSGQDFESRQILVKHSEEYVEDNPDRVEYQLDGTELDETAPEAG